MDITLENYKGSNIEKGFSNVEPITKSDFLKIGGHLNSNLEKGFISQELFENATEELQKASGHKYFKREGVKGKYKYYYTQEDYNKSKASEKVLETLKPGSDKHRAMTNKINRIEQEGKEDAEAADAIANKGKYKREIKQIDKKIEGIADKKFDLKYDLNQAKQSLSDAKKNHDNTVGSEQEAHAGDKQARGEEWSDTDANKFYSDYIEPAEKQVKEAEKDVAEVQTKVDALDKEEHELLTRREEIDIYY